MPITSSAGLVHLVRGQTDYTESPPIYFPNVTPDPTVKWSFCIWVKQKNQNPNPVLIGWYCSGGSRIEIKNDGYTWHLALRYEAVAQPLVSLGLVQHNKWQLFCFAKDGPNITIYTGVEAPLEENPWEDPVLLTNTYGPTNCTIDESVNGINLNVFDHTDVCCFKFWNTAVLTKEQFESQANEWDASGSPAPIWVCPMRTAGDINNIANPYSSPYWDKSHSWLAYYTENLATGGLVGRWNDPAYMASVKVCPTWLYPDSSEPFVPPLFATRVYVNPGMTPLNPTDYKAPQFFQFKDKGAIPANDATLTDIRYYGYLSYGPEVGVHPSEAWGLYKDEADVEYQIKQTSNSFIQTGRDGLVIPGLPRATTIYRWKFGAFFTWNPVAPQAATSTANITNMMLYAKYIGFPTGFPLIPKDQLSGLFAIDPLSTTRQDVYNNGVTLKIPNPTLRTAYIGE